MFPKTKTAEFNAYLARQLQKQEVSASIGAKFASVSDMSQKVFNHLLHTQAFPRLNDQDAISNIVVKVNAAIRSWLASRVL
jgi:hypothetical protein